MRQIIIKAGICVLALLGVFGLVFWENKEALQGNQMEISIVAGEQIISAWEQEGIYYVFLPSYAQKEQIRLTSYSAEFTVKQEQRLVEQGELLGDLPTDCMIPCINAYTKEEFSLCIMQSANLPALFLDTDSGTIEQVCADKEYEENGELTVVDGSGNVQLTVGLSSVKGRGNTSFANYEKKPFSIITKEEVSLLDMGLGQEYALLSNASEPTLIRNDIMRAMEEAMGLPYAKRGRFVDLYINQEYQGNYYLCAEMEIGTQRIAITDTEQAMDLFYSPSGYESAENYETDDRKGKLLEVNLTDITGGYLVERDFEQRYKAEYAAIGSGFITGAEEHFVVKSPKYCSEEQIEYLGDYFEEAEQAILREDGINPDTGKVYTDYIDIDSFAKKYLAEEISKDYDGGVSSSYFYKDSDLIDSRIYAAPGWDYDMSLGNFVEWMEYFSKDPKGISKLSLHTYATPWFQALYEKDEFYGKTVDYYENYAAPFLDRLLTEELDVYYETLQASTAMNHVRWAQELAQNPYYRNREESFEELRNFLTERKAFLDSAWLEGQLYHIVTYWKDDVIVAIDYVKEGETLGELPKPEGTVSNRWCLEETGEKVLEDLMITKDTRIIWQK